METSLIDKANKILFFMILRRHFKFKTKNLIELFQDIRDFNEIKDFEETKLIKILYRGRKIKLDDYKIIEQLRNVSKINDLYHDYLDILNYMKLHEIKVISALDNEIPLIFRHLKPVERDLIFVLGNIIDEDAYSFSICGTRNPTNKAVQKTEKIASYFAKNGLTLINGFAKGIDIAAYRGALKENGRYIAVLASGVKNIYPAEHSKFARDIISNGAIISQRFPKERVNQRALQIRNRLSASLSLGSIFIEGTFKSGTKHQLKFANEKNKLLFYLEPEDWNHQNSVIPKLVKDNGGFMIKKDLSNLDEVLQIFKREYTKLYNTESN